jgi:hypothetical protein
MDKFDKFTIGWVVLLASFTLFLNGCSIAITKYQSKKVDTIICDCGSNGITKIDLPNDTTSSISLRISDWAYPILVDGLTYTDTLDTDNRITKFYPFEMDSLVTLRIDSSYKIIQ